MKWAIWRRLERVTPLVGVRETGPRNKRSHNLRILVLMPADFAIETADLAKIFRTRWTRREVRAVALTPIAGPWFWPAATLSPGMFHRRSSPSFREEEPVAS